MAYRALILPDSRIEVWDAESTITQAGPRSGVPVASQAGSMVLGSKGTQDAGTSLDIRTQRGGHPIRGGGAYIWRRTGETDDQWRGWDPPTSISAWEAATFTNGSITPEWTRYPHVVDAGGTLMVCVAYRDSSIANEYGVRVYRREAGLSQWAAVNVWGQTTALTTPARSCMMVLPSGRVHLYSIVAVGTTRTVVLYYSDDNGLTWAYGGDVLNTSLSNLATSLDKIRAIYHRGQAMMLVEATFSSGTTNRALHYASDDQGLTWDLVEIADLTQPAKGWDLTPCESGICLVVYSPITLSLRSVRATVLSDAYDTIPIFFSWTTVYDADDAGTELNLSGSVNLSVGRTDDGALLAYYIVGDAATPTTVTGNWSISWDDGETWTTLADSLYIASKWWRTNTPDYPSDFATCWYRGSMALVGNWVATTGNEDDSIGVWFLGSYTSVTQPPLYRTTDWRQRATWTVNWVPIELPGDAGWTAAGAGTQSLQAPGVLSLSCTSAQTRTYTRTPIGAPDQHQRVRFVVRPTSGGDIASDRIAARVRIGDGATASYDVSVRFSTTQLQVYDNVAGTNVGGPVDVTDLSSQGAEVLIGLTPGFVQVWYRTRNPADTDHLYTLAASGAVSNGGAAAATIVFGMLATSATTDTCSWYEMHYADDDDGGAQTWGSTSYPVDLAGRDYGDTTYTDAGASVVARDGPTWRGEEWVIATRYEYGIDRALTVPSPRAGWRTTSTGAQVLAFRWDTIAPSSPESPYLGILLSAQTLTRLSVDLYQASGWVSVGTVDLGWTGLGAGRSGGVVTPSGSADLWLDYGEATGASLALSSTVARRVGSHGEGRWQASYDLRPTLRLVDAVSGDPVTATATLTPSTVVLIVRVANASQGVRLTQAAPDGTNPPPPDAYWQVGSVLVGWVRPLDDPDWGTSEATEADIETDEARDGTTRSRIAGPTRRVRSVSWSSGWRDQTEHRWGQPSQRLTLGTSPMAARYGVPLSMPAIIDRLSGGHTPIVYLPSLPESVGDLHVIRRRGHVLYGRVSDEIAQTVVLGEEGVDEAMTLGEMTITEEV